MSAYLEKVLRHAEKNLFDQTSMEPTDVLDLYRRFVKREEYSLQVEHSSGEGGRMLTHKRADFISVMLRHIWENAYHASKKAHPESGIRLVLLAVGGFGRGELNPYSDIDIEFLYSAENGEHPAAVGDMVQHISYMLWDIGFHVGAAATRTPEEMLKAANNDFRTKTSLLEVRYLCGDEALFESFKTSFHEQCLVGQEEAYLQWRKADQTARHAKSANTVFLQEPNIKSGCGGLRDYHNLRWVALVKRGFNTMLQLVEAKIVTPSESKQLDSAYDFLLRLRTELHYQQRRNGDILSLRLQGQIANAFRYPHRTILRRSEALMREYYENASLLYTLGNAVSERLCGPSSRPEHKLTGKAAEKREMDGFILQNGVLELSEGSVFGVDKLRLIRVFLHAQHHNAVLSPSTKLRLRRRVYLIDRPYIYQQAIREMMWSLFSRKGEVGRILRMMHELGVLGRLFPEFRPLTCLVQHEFFHQYTADEHTLVCIEVIDKIVDATEAPHVKYRVLMQHVSRPHLLYLAMLLHDTGKSENGKLHSQASATLAVKAARRLKLPPNDIAVLVFLVDHHLTMSEIARRQNLEDEATIVGFARIVQTQERLDLLMLLTFADVLGTGATRNYSDWKDLLLWQLYRRTTTALSGVQEFVEAGAKARLEMQQEIILQMSVKIDRAEVVAHFDKLPGNYFNTVPEQLIRLHIQLVHDFLIEQAKDDGAFLRPMIKWQNYPEKGYSEVTVVTWDRDRLFVRVTGSFAASNLTILKADVFTRQDDIAIETLFVATDLLEAAVDPRDRKQFEKFLYQAMAESEFDFTHVLARKRKPRPSSLVGLSGLEESVVPVRISIDQQASPTHSLLDVQTADYPGLLHRIAGVIADLGMNISTARISTEKGAALDTFYLTGNTGKKVADEALLTRLTSRLRAEITA